jgi:hypothetical protein
MSNVAAENSGYAMRSASAYGATVNLAASRAVALSLSRRRMRA